MASKKSDPKSWCFPATTLTFLKDLKANNNRDWFTQNKAVYETAIKQPAEEFCALMTDRLAQLTGLPHTSKIYRIYRDVRFSKDKTPYNDHLHLSFFPDQTNGVPPAWHFGLAPERLSLGAGLFGFDKPALEHYRKRVAGPDGADLDQLLERLVQEGGRVNEPELKRVPSPYDQDHQSADLLRRKGLAIWFDLEPPEIAATPKIIDECVTNFTRMKPVFDWLLPD